MINKIKRSLLVSVAVCSVGSAVADDHHPMHHQFPKDVDAFHSVLAPIWHSPPGKERLQNACAKAGQMDNLAKGIRSIDASQLVEAISVLKLKCQGDRAEVDAALFDVHESFHRLIEPKPAVSAR